MKFDKLKFWKRPAPEPEPENETQAPQSPSDMLRIARQVEARIDKLVNQIYSSRLNSLMHQDITYIVPAVWGAVKEGGLDDVQMEIHELVEPAFRDAMSAFGFQNLEQEQLFAVGYLVRSLIVTKTVYMIEATRRRQVESRTSVDLGNVDPEGEA